MSHFVVFWAKIIITMSLVGSIYLSGLKNSILTIFQHEKNIFNDFFYIYENRERKFTLFIYEQCCKVSISKSIKVGTSIIRLCRVILTEISVSYIILMIYGHLQ